MKHNSILLAIAIVGITSCNNATDNTAATAPAADTTAATAAATPPPPMPDSATMAKNLMDYATPGDAHKAIASEDGKWNIEMTFWMAPDAPPQVTKGTCENKMVLGGRYQQSIYKADMMGMPFEGMGYTGYDNGKNIVMSTWIDNMGTGIMYMEGPYNEATKTTELKGTTIDPGTRTEKSIRQTLKTIDNNTIEMEMFETPMGGTERKTMAIKYTRI